MSDYDYGDEGLEVPNASVLMDVINQSLRRLEEVREIRLKLEEDVKFYKEQEKQIEEHEIPDALQELGVDRVRLTDGTELIAQERLHASIPKKHKLTAIKWLRDHGHDAIVKNDVTVSFGKGEDERARELKELLKQRDDVFREKTHVHPQTLGAFLRELDEEGVEFPEDVFGVYRKRSVRVRKP